MPHDLRHDDLQVENEDVSFDRSLVEQIGPMQELQAKINAAGMGDPRDKELDALRSENERLREDNAVIMAADKATQAENERLRARLTEIAELDLEGDASLADALHIADEALNP